MVDFKKHLGSTNTKKETDPIRLYETLDRASDKGPLRKIQERILTQWYEKRRNDKDLILKLHTGQGKTLVGLLMLQSKINEGKGPALYLCPNKMLVSQTCEQAKQFGIPVVTTDDDLPSEYLNGEKILITTVKKLFNGKSKFGIGSKYEECGCVLMDDSHSCVDIIRQSFSIHITRGDSIYEQLLTLFSNAIKNQGIGTYEDIKLGNHDVFSIIPYWDWINHKAETVSILSKNQKQGDLPFTWPILKDQIDKCSCYVSGDSIEITPHLAPLDLFGAYWKASCRIFMSATITNDAFLVRGLQLGKEVIANPLVDSEEKWAGEKMILLPSTISDDLDRSNIVNKFAPLQFENFGVVTLVPSKHRTLDWGALNAEVITLNNIDNTISSLKDGVYGSLKVLVNRYDGIDLPDNSCRILLIDSLPQGKLLSDRYMESVRPESDSINVRLARTIEQGMGRSVRGEKDYSVIILIGTDLVKFIEHPNTKSLLSDQTNRQIEIGRNISKMAQDEISEDKSPFEALKELINQCLRRDSDWKEYYVEQMNSFEKQAISFSILDAFEIELEAEIAFQKERNPSKACDIIQQYIDRSELSNEEKGYFLQEKARYSYESSRSNSIKTQLAAHKNNRYLLLPENHVNVSKLNPIPYGRITAIEKWMSKFSSYEEMKVEINDICSNLNWGISADKFEAAFRELGNALGFNSERPDKEWKSGPDNLWCLDEGNYLLVECKNEVNLNRSDIYKDESGQMNNSIGWFNSEYKNCTSENIMIIPTKKMGNGAYFNEDVSILMDNGLRKLRNNVNSFFNEFKQIDIYSISEDKISELLNLHHLSIKNLKNDYTKKPIIRKSMH